MLLLPALAHAATLSVGPTETYATIGDALAVAASGDTVQVAPGVYSETPDLRGLNVTLTSRDGPWTTTIVASGVIYTDGGTFEGFTLSPASATAVAVMGGSPSVRELIIEGPSATGVSVQGGTPIVEEVLVRDAGAYAFVVKSGTPTLRRLVSIDAGQYGFQFQSLATASNLLAIGGAYGIVGQVDGLSVSQCVVVGATGAAVAPLADATFTNCAFLDDAKVAECFNGAVATFPNGVAGSGYSTKNCDASTLDNVANVDPRFTMWSATASFYSLDFSPVAGSPMIDGGSGTDADGSTADLGIFGGPSGAWADGDGDSAVVLFDCDDHAGDRSWGAVESADGVDDDCDGSIDEDVPVDTGEPPDTGDSGEPVDTDDSGEPVDTDDSGTGTDTGTAGGADIDGDGWTTPDDCGDHNIASYPGAPERLDGTDNDCDGVIDNGTPGGDDDNDSYSEMQGDCDDTDDTRHPGAEEVSRDGIDQDCDGLDENPRGVDADGDGFTDEADCDDTDPLVFPTAPDPLNGVDDDCDGTTDDDYLNGDADGDGVTPGEGDCDDADATVAPNIFDTADDFIDQDCSGEDNYDVDRDGHASPTSGGDDCADSLSSVYPGAYEDCDDEYDNDCDLVVNEDCDDGSGGGDDGCGGCSNGGVSGLTWAFVALAGVLRRRSNPRNP